MELFREDGHMTDEGLRAIVADDLDELARLEASEHLSFCDECLVRYLALLEEAPLLAPETPVRTSVMRRIKKRARTILFSRYATVAAAVCLVVAMWGSGFYQNISSRAEEASQPDTGLTTAQQEAPREKTSTFLNNVANDAAGAVNGFFNALGKPTGGSAIEAEDRQALKREKAERDKKEAVFNQEDKDGANTATDDKTTGTD